jgi:hypothetical protein
LGIGCVGARDSPERDRHFFPWLGSAPDRNRFLLLEHRMVAKER